MNESIQESSTEQWPNVRASGEGQSPKSNYSNQGLSLPEEKRAISIPQATPQDDDNMKLGGSPSQSSESEKEKLTKKDMMSEILVRSPVQEVGQTKVVYHSLRETSFPSTGEESKKPVPPPPKPQREQPTKGEEPKILAHSPPKPKRKKPVPPPPPKSEKQYKVKKTKKNKAPFLVLGYTGYTDSKKLPRLPPPKSERVKPPRLSGTHSFKTPWSGKPLRVHKWKPGFADLELPPYSNIIGMATNPECFPEGSVEVFPLEGETVLQYNDISGIIIPQVYPRNGRVICRKARFVGGGDVPQDHRLSCAISVVDDCNVLGSSEKGSMTSRLLRDTKTFIFCSDDYDVREIDSSFVRLHDPMIVPNLFSAQKDDLIIGIPVRIPYMPVLVLIASGTFMIVPGLIQLYGSQDNMWGDILNQIIGTGSVLVGVVFFILERAFGPGNIFSVMSSSKVIYRQKSSQEQEFPN